MKSDEAPTFLEIEESHINEEHEHKSGHSSLNVPRAGEGSYADVYRGLWAASGLRNLQNVALKRLRFQKTGTGEERFILRQVRTYFPILHLIEYLHCDV